MDGGDGVDLSVVSRLMLKFRPIAPKPVAKESAAEGSSEASDHQLKHLRASKVKLPKRKYARNRTRNIKQTSSKRTGKLSRQKEEGGRSSREEMIKQMDVITLQLLPDKAEEKLRVNKETRTSSSTSLEREKPLPFMNSVNSIFDMLGRSSDTRLSINSRLAVSPLAPFSMDVSSRFTTSDDAAVCLLDQQPSSTSATADFQLLLQPPERTSAAHVQGVSGSRAVVAVIETVIVDCYMTTDPRELGCTDTEIIKNLGLETSPGFVSDLWNKIRWVNGAFRKMVTTVQDPLVEVAAVVLEAKDELPKRCRAFSGRVRVKLRRDYRDGDPEEELTKKMSCCKWKQVVPCDVWRMDCGVFAWRLDTKAALTLGRLS